MIYDNNILFQCTSTGNKDDEMNFMYIWLIKSTLYNFLYKLRSGFGREDDFTANKWTWFDIQICITFLLTQTISWPVLDYTKTGRVIGYLKNTVQLPSVSETDSNGILTLYVHVPKNILWTIYIGLNDSGMGRLIFILSTKQI